MSAAVNTCHSSPPWVGVATLVVAILILCVTGLVAFGVGKLRDDFRWWQVALHRIEWHTDPGKKGVTPPWKGDLQKWLDDNPDRPHKHDPPFTGGH